ncbi:GNAT family N-acetyltransferase [Gordonia phosphorivorans]|uniref:GNAT family N-acetyltransferase n=1 Tax=Gordonia phosphorivorans TaxID=1056982 RepID=A0ABV6H8V7_9ACTN
MHAAAPVITTVTDPTMADEIAAVAAATFPLACPPHITAENIAVHIAKNLNAERFAEWIGDDDHDVIAATEGPDGPVLGYTLLVHRPPTADDVRAVVPGDEITEISKMYVLPDHHGPRSTGRPAHLLMHAALAAARARGSALVWLGVNSGNERAQRYYAKMGFTVAGPRTFDMNGTLEHDYVMTRTP